jgi:3-oxoacyl-[acyl-carrier protein] reductase
MKLAGRVALVTGAGRGFGRAIALALAGAGADIAVNYRASAAAAAEVVREIEKRGRAALAVQADVSREADVRSLIEAVRRQFGRLDILVNNAGIMVHGPFQEVPLSRYEPMLTVNVMGTMRCTYHALPAMMANKHGRIINLSSQLARRAVSSRGGFAAYAATKGAVESFTRSIAQEFGPFGITANAIAPGGIETDMSRGVMTAEYRNRRLQELPLRRFGSVEDVAYCAVFLAADEAGYLTGQIIHPSGGWMMG